MTQPAAHEAAAADPRSGDRGPRRRDRLLAALGRARARPRSRGRSSSPRERASPASPTSSNAAGAIRGGAGTFRVFARLFGSSRSDPGRRVPDPAAAQRRRHPQPAPARPAGAAAGDDPRRHALGAGPRAADARSPSSPARSPVPEEGSVLPNSYSYRRGESARGGAGADAGGDAARAGAALGAAAAGRARWRRPREAIILASIVEKETGKPAERRLVAGVYANRLRRGMPLQADPTVIYPVTRGRPLGRRILQSELRRRQRLQHLCARRPAGRADRQSRAARRSPPCSIRRRPTRSISSPTARGGHVFADTLAAAPGQCRALVRDPPRPRRDAIA